MSTKLTNENPSSPLADADGSVIWVVACILRKPGDITGIFHQTISWQGDCTENEAKCQAVSYALESAPGFAIELMTVARIELPSPNDKCSHGAENQKA